MNEYFIWLIYDKENVENQILKHLAIEEIPCSSLSVVPRYFTRLLSHFCLTGQEVKF